MRERGGPALLGDGDLLVYVLYCTYISGSE